MKTCIKCGSTSRKKNGDCQPCAIKRDTEYKKANRDKRRIQAKEYYAANRARIRAASRLRDKENPAKKRSSDKAYREANKEKVAAHKRKHYIANIDSIKQRSKDWVAENHVRVKANMAKYYRENPEKAVDAKAKRRNRIGTDRLPYGAVPAQFKAQNGLCACCGVQLIKYHVDHIMPLALGGRNIPENIQLLTPKCNQRKSAKHPDVWRAELHSAA